MVVPEKVVIVLLLILKSSLDNVLRRIFWAFNKFDQLIE